MYLEFCRPSLRKLVRSFNAVMIAFLASVFAQNNAFAVEGGSGAYLLGSRDIGAGFVPPPGFYQTNDFVYLTGKVDQLAIGGVGLTNAELNVLLYKGSFTYASPKELLGARMAINVTVPYASAHMDFNGVLGGAIAGQLSDSEYGFGDITVTPMLGWDFGNYHFNLAGSMFLPTGQYSTASISLAPLGVDVLSISKNKFAFDPTLSVTYLDPTTGFELTGSAGITFSYINRATDYQTAPEFHFEGVVARHLSNGITLGLTGYAYQQLKDDSGSGAENFKTVTGAKSLQARVFAAGPVLAWNTKVGTTGVSMKLKYIYEFGARRRFESQGLFGNIGFAF
jgi:hypothetical protein